MSKIAVKCKRGGEEQGAVRCIAKGRGGTECALVRAHSYRGKDLQMAGDGSCLG